MSKKKQLKKVESSKIVTIEQPASEMAAMIERMVMNPEVDASKMQLILDMKHSEEDRDAEKAYTRAMVRTQKGLRAVTRDKVNPQTRSSYPSLEAMAKAVVPAYTAEGLAISYGEGVTDKQDQIRVTCKVMHEDGHSENFFYDCPVDDKGIAGKVNKTATHGKASGVSYGQRYLLKMIFNVTIQDEDDDGNAAGKEYEELISDDQYSALTDIINGIETDFKVKDVELNLCMYLGVQGLKLLPERGYKKAVHGLTTKRNKLVDENG